MEETIYQVTQRIIGQLVAEEETSSSKAILSALRHSIGKPLGQAYDVWPIILANIPDVYLSRSGVETKEEKAIYVALQLYALQKQGKKGKEIKTSAKNIGEALGRLRGLTGNEALDRRFVSAMSAKSFDSFVYNLRQLLKLAKSKDAIALDFSALADDLYWYQQGQEKRIKLRWAEAYYRKYEK